MDLTNNAAEEKFQAALQRCDLAVQHARAALACYDKTCPARRFGDNGRTIAKQGLSRFLLIVDDEDAIARSVKSMTESLCGRVQIEIAHSSDEALTHLFKPVSGAIVDWFLAGNTARNLLDSLVQRGIPCCIFTGDITRIPQDVPCPVIGKGDPAVLQRWICEIIGVKEWATAAQA